ncbi:hypothetical protein HXX76_004555 [Chlamydomonas incerta]|uniref:Uncharacterized protein n=1 Tax=Chlamydomonas incerta TaxID=51695 RepID=A0A835T5A6_CHLIN|nr:hypothetical protein HXX76_004555 [Chlamydomonas incerta]|eukprot:KAG2439192.1 hypothetical protein HXX76_004555 [Chlamydomonas incerta]
MVSRKEAAAAFTAAAKALQVRGKELGDLCFALSKLSVEELEVFPIDGDNEAIVEFMRSAKASAAGLGVGSAAGAGAAAGQGTGKAASAASLGVGTAVGADAERPRDQQAASPTSSGPRKSATWWPACWLQSVAPLWKVRRGGDEGGPQQQEQQEQGVGAVVYAATVGLLLLLKITFAKQCSTAETGCSWWLAGSVEQGASLLIQVLHAIGVLTQLGAHQLVDHTAGWLQLHALVAAFDAGLRRVPFLPAGVRRIVVRTLVECAAAVAAMAVHCVSLAGFGMVADLASRVSWVRRG